MSRTTRILPRRLSALAGALATVLAVMAALGAGSASAAAFSIETFDGGLFDAAGNAFTQAGGRPYSASTTFTFPHYVDQDGLKQVRADVKEVDVDLPPGLIGNPQATPQCSQADFGFGLFSAPKCAAATQVGTVTLDLSGLGLGTGPVYSLDPPEGTPALFGFQVGTVDATVAASVRTGSDYGITLKSKMISQGSGVIGVTVTLWGVPADPSHDAERYCIPLGNTVAIPGCSSGTPMKPFVSLPTSCAGPQVTTMNANSWQAPDLWDSASFVSHDTNGMPIGATGCGLVPFKPQLAISPDTTAADAPSGLDVDLSVPQDDAVGGLATAHVKDVTVALPEGMSVSPSAANGLQACSDAQVALKSDAAVACPAASRLGSVTVDTPLLEDPLEGSIFLGSQESMDPMSGKMFRLFLVASSKQAGVTVKLPGSVTANPVTGKLVASFKQNPQLPFDRLHVKFFGGPGGSLATPKACGRYATGTAISSWAGQDADLSSSFEVACRAGLGWFAPYFTAGTVAPMAGASSPFALRVAKPDGQADLNQLALVLPEGLLGRLKGNIGHWIGTARVASGPGPRPYWLAGPVVLEGPYKGALFSLKVTVPAVAGPFNLGNVVVRQRIFVDPHDAHVTVVSDPLPTIVKGVPVRLQDLAVDIDVPGFMRNPTSCAPKVIGGTLGSVTGQFAAVSSRFQVGDCAKLPLAPKMRMELKGKGQIKRGKHPTLSTTLTQQAGESALKKVKVRLPLSLALDPDNARDLCKPGEAAAKACPPGSIVGHATAISPLLDLPLSGNVYFVEGTRKSKTGRTVKTLPKLWVALRGQVAIDLWADSAIGDGKYLVTTFGFVPDAPISSFRLDIDGGEHGILAVTGDSGANLCQNRLITDATYDGQNGKQVTDKVRMDSPCGFGVRKTSMSKTHAKVTVSGIGAGKLSISGKGIHKAHRTIKHSSVATISPRLTDYGMRAAKSGKALRLKVSWNPKKKGEKTKSDRATVKRAKAESSTRSRSDRTR